LSGTGRGGTLRAVRGMHIVGGNMVCMMPTKDSPNQITALTAMAVMFEMFSMVAENRTK
jgi:guanidinopropionase